MGVRGQQGQPVLHSGGRDPDVIRGDALPPCFQRVDHAAVFVGGLVSGIKDFDDAQNTLDFGRFFGAPLPLALAFVDTVAQLAQSG